MSNPEADKGLELPADLREQVLQCAVEKQISLDWLINLYRRGFNAKMGATGEFPYGKLEEHDDGELTVGVTTDVPNGVVRIVFGKKVAWLALPPIHVRHLAKVLLERAADLEKKLS